MNRPKKLSEVKVGDTVFVVNQQLRYGRHSKLSEPSKQHETITRVGRRYGYFKRYGREQKFDLKTGESVHKEYFERANGHGFDVYLSESDYLDQQHSESERQRLQDRLIGMHGRLVDDLSREAIAAIHKILDKDQQR